MNTETHDIETETAEMPAAPVIWRDQIEGRLRAANEYLDHLYGTLPYSNSTEYDRKQGLRLLGLAAARGYDGDIRRMLNAALRSVRTHAVEEIDVVWLAAYELRVSIHYIKAHVQMEKSR